MSSDKKIKFTTQATTKGAGAEVTSDTISLSRDTKDHILNVKADSSCIGQVDVELEMSPDGTNWCPAVTRTVSVTPGASISERTGNEEYVKLTPDAGEFKNKHCRGGLNFDVNGSVVTPDGSGARDLMHQHIGVNKSFNYSQWFKTSENPTTTYKPVLFRHGGYDDFTNQKTVELIDEDASSTSVTNTGQTNDLIYEWSSFSTNTLKQDQAWTLGYWVDLTGLDPAQDVSFGQSHVSTGNFGLYTTLYRYGNNAGGVSNRTYLNFQYRFSVAMSANAVYYGGIGLEKLFVVFRSDGSGQFDFDLFDEDANVLASTTWNKTVSSQTYTGTIWDGQSGVNKCDELFVLDNYVSDANLSTLYQTINNKIYPADYASMSGIQCLYQMEPTTGDTKAQVTSAVDTSGNTFPSTLVNTSFTSSDAISSLTSSDKLYMPGVIKTTQNLCAINKNEYSVKVEDQSYAGTTNTINVTVANNGTSNKFYVDGVSSTGILNLAEGTTYIFDQSDASNSGHPLRFSTTSDGTHGGGSEYTTGVTTNGTPGTAGAYTQIVVASSAPTLYTYCTQHSGMGGEINTEPVLKRPQLKLSNASGTFINPFKKSTDSNPNTLPVIESADFNVDDDLGITISANIKVSGPGTGTNYNQKYLWQIFLEDSNGNPKGRIITLFSKVNSNFFNMYMDENNNQLAYYGRSSSTVLNGSWNHISCNFIKKPVGTAHQQAFYSRISINGDTPPQGAGSANGSFQDFSNLVVSKVELGGGRDYDIDIEIDNLCFYTGWLNKNNNWTNIYNARKDPLTFSSPNMELKSCFIMGDGADDRSNHIYKDIVEPSSGRQFVKYDSISAPVSVALTSSDDPYSILLPNKMPTIFSTGIASSISGWFKTTDTGTLFSNRDSSQGLKVEVTDSGIDITHNSTVVNYNNGGPFNDGEWHHFCLRKYANNNYNLLIDYVSAGTTYQLAQADTDWQGSNGFTLLSDGDNNASANSPASTDSSKLGASLSNWSLHTEDLSNEAISHLYSNGHVRNIKNIPSVDANSIVAWWKFDSTTNPEQDIVGPFDLQYQDGGSAALTTKVIDATGATLVEDSINGNAMTLSLTKSFNFTTNKWVSTADQDTALCLSLNGFEEQAEHVALWKCSQTIAGSTIDICDGDWHNVILSYRGNNDLAGNNVAEGDTVKFGPGPAQSLPFNWCMSYDGQPLTAIKDGSGADYIDGLGTIVTDTYNSVTYNVGFAIHNRHVKYETSNAEEVYKPHAQFSAGIHEVTGVNNNNAFQGSVDETSFHSDCWWVDQAGTSVITNTFNQEKPATIYGNTTALSNRQASNTDYPEGKPYDLLHPERLTTSGLATDIEGTNQYINPNQYDSSTNPNGGLEGWWRWGDTPGDCSVTINDVRDHNDSINTRDINAFGIVTADRVDMNAQQSPESIYLTDRQAGQESGAAAITFPQVIVQNIQANVCNIKQIVSPLLHYLRVKFTGSGSCDLGDTSVQAQINYKVKD